MDHPALNSSDSPPADHGRCDAADCTRPPNAELGARLFCLEHFLHACRDELESRNDRLKSQPFDPAASDAFKNFLAECARQSKRLAEEKSTTDPQLQARLLDILLRASDLRQRLRRSPRRPVSVPIWLRREDPGRTWEEETHTTLVSRHGAGIECHHGVEAGGTLVLSRKDNGRRARARVAFCRFDDQGRRQIGVEFLDRDDFWDLDWNSASPAACHPEPAVAGEGSQRNNSPRGEIPRRDSSSPPSQYSGTESTQSDSALAGRAVAHTPDAWLSHAKVFWQALELRDTRRLKKLLAYNFEWVSDRGRRTRRAVLDTLEELHTPGALADDYQLTILGPGCALITFRASRKSGEAEAPPRVTYHASLWLTRDSRPVLVFHQVTPV